MYSANEVLFVLEKPIVVKKLVLDIYAVEVTNYQDPYYWYLNLFGCLSSDGKCQK